MSKVKLTKEQAALVPGLQTTWTVFSDLTPEQQEVTLKWDGDLAYLTRNGKWSGYFNMVDGHYSYSYRIPQDAEYEVVWEEQEYEVIEEPGYVDVPVEWCGGFLMCRYPNSIKSYGILHMAGFKGFLGYIWPDSDEPSAEWFRVGKDGVEYCSAVRFKKGGEG